MNKNGVNVSSCKTPVTMSKKLVSPSGKQTNVFMVLWSIIIAVKVSLGRPCVRSI